jgi:AcrR family transcriptional regulator
MKGRPTGSTDRNLSDSLLSAARSCLHGRSHLDLTSREIATNAGTHAAMVNYYFGSKDGLFSSLVDQVVVNVSRRIRRIEADIDAGIDDPTSIIVRGLIEAYQPYTEVLPVAIIEVLRQGTEIKSSYCRHGGTQTFARVTQIIRTLVDRGHYRRDLDITNMNWMILSLVVGPHILRPIWQAMGAVSETPDGDRWIADAVEALRRHAQA